jgi:hypothetical protein
VFLAKIYAGSIIALRLYTWLLALVALLAGLAALFNISVLTYELILSPSPDELARKGVSLCLLVAVSAAIAYLFYIMLAGHIIALKDKEVQCFAISSLIYSEF